MKGCRLSVFENRVLRRIFGPKRDEATKEGPVLFTKYHLDDQVKKTEMGRTCGTYGERRGAYRALLGKLREGDHLEDPGVDWTIILKWIFEKLNGGRIDWVDLAQDRDRWRALVYTVMNLRVP
jgi:hypothetical protein